MAVAAQIAGRGGALTFLRLEARVSGDSLGRREESTDRALESAQKGLPCGLWPPMYNRFPTRGLVVGTGPARGEQDVVDLGGDHGEAETCLDVRGCDVYGPLEELREGSRGFCVVQLCQTLNSDYGHGRGLNCWLEPWKRVGANQLRNLRPSQGCRDCLGGRLA